MKIRIRHRGEDTKNLCQASFHLPASAEGKDVKVLSVRAPDMPLIPAQTAGFVVESTIHNFVEMINTPAFGSLEQFVDYLNQLWVDLPNNRRVFEGFAVGNELSIEVLHPIAWVTWNLHFQSMLTLPAVHLMGEFSQAEIWIQRFDPNIETEVLLHGVHVDGVSDGEGYTDRIAIFGRDRVLSGEKCKITSSDTAVSLRIQYIDDNLAVNVLHCPDDVVWGVTLEID